MSRNSSLYTAFLCVLCCSAAVALQPSVRAGSISLNSGVKPVANTVTSTSNVSTSAKIDSSRGSTLSKFSQAVVPVSRANNNNNSGGTVTSDALEELRQQIAELRTAQLGLENNQITRSEMETTIENTVKNLDLTTANNDLKTKLSDISSSNQTLQSDVAELQELTTAFNDDLDSALDNRLRIRGLVSNTEINDIIRQDLINREILTNSGTLNVEKKGEVQVTEASVTDALRNSDNFKRMVADEVATKGYLTDSSDTITNLARKSDALTAKVDGDVETEGSLLYQIKHDEQIRNDLKGDPGQDGSSVSAEEVANALKGDSTFVKGITGKDANSIWYEYCNSGTNLTSIIQYLYPSVTNCDDFTSEQYNALTTGPKGQCLVWALKSEDLNPSDGIGARLVKVFGNGILDNLNSYHVGTKVMVNNTNGTSNLDFFVNACEKSYDKIMAAEDPITVEMAYCKEQAKNYPDGTTNLTIIQKLYPQVTNCNQFTSSMYTAITNGAKGYCLSLAQDPDNLTADSGIGAKLVELFGEGVIEDLKRSFAETYVSVRGAKAPRNFIDACIDNYDAIMAGKDAKSVEQVYCESNSANSNISNLSIIQKFYPSVQNCSQFETYMYTSITSGAKGYCLSLAQNPNDLSSDSGIGAKLVRLFGDDIIRELNNNTVNTYVSVNGAKAVKSFLEACEENYNEIISGKDAKSIEQVYCESRAENYDENTTNLTIIRKFYPNVQDCSQFEPYMYTAITSGAKGYCLSLVEKADELSATEGIGLKLTKVFGSEIIINLQSSGLNTNVSVNGAKAPKNFLEACEENYDAIMSGKDAKTTEELYCEAQAKNYPEGTTNLTIIQKLYPVVQNCSQFTIEMYSNIMGGAKGYCLSLAQKPEDLTSDSTIGERLIKLFGESIIEDLKRNFTETTVSVNGAKAPKSFLEACADNYDAIMAGKDADSVEKLYCEARAENYNDGTTNLVAIIQKLYPSQVETCDDFTPEMYTAITSGAKAFCISIAKKPTDLSADSGIGARLVEIFGAGIINELQDMGLTANVTPKGAKAAKNFVEACEENYDAIISGKDAKSIELIYCESNADNYNNTSNLTIIQHLYPEVSDCSMFDPKMYAEMTNGAKAYCLSLANNPEELRSDAGIGLKLEKVLEEGIVEQLKRSKIATEIDGENFVNKCESKYTDIIAGDDALGFTYKERISVYGNLPATCEQGDAYYVDDADQIEEWQGLLYICNCNTVNNVTTCGFPAQGQGVKFKGDPGESAKPVHQEYCEAQAKNYEPGTSNLTVIQKLYPVVQSCSQFTIEMYSNIMGGAKGYCLSLAQKPEDLTADSSIGERLIKLFGDSVIDDLKQNFTETTVSVRGAKAAKNFLDACVENYDAIMAGKDADSLEKLYCESRAENSDDENATNFTAIISKLYPQLNSCDEFTAEMYTAITSGAKGYCISIAKDPSNLDASSGIGARLVEIFGDTIISELADHGLDANATAKGAKAGKKFVEACEENYNAIMAGKDAKSAEQVYCEAPAENFDDGTTNLYIIQKFYSIGDCSEFDSKMYASMISGARSHCISLAEDPSGLSATEGIGLKLEKLFGEGFVELLKQHNVDTEAQVTTKSQEFTKGPTKTAMNFIKACELKYDEIIAGEDAKSVERTYCETGDNLTKIITPLLGIDNCDDFDNQKYQSIVSGAKAYCLSLATDPENMLPEGSAMVKKLKKAFGNDIVDRLTLTGAGTEVTSSKSGAKGPEKFVNECATRYDEIMGILPIETEFCETEDRLEKIIKPLYGNDMTCDTFTNANYQAILGGAKAYCLSLVEDAKANKLDVNTGVGAKLEKILGTGIIDQVKVGGAATPVTITKAGAKAATDTNFVLACEEKYNEIVAGTDALGFTYRDKVATYADLPTPCEQGDGYSVEDASATDEKWHGMLYICNCNTIDTVTTCGYPERGQGVQFQGPKGENGKSAEQAYCEANFDTVSALYPETITAITDCPLFTPEQYKAMLEGAKTYCLFIAKDFMSGTLTAEAGIGKKLNERLKIAGSDDGIFTLKDRKAPITLTELLKTQKFNDNESFLEACEAQYNEIMAGDKGEDAKSAEQTYCETNFATVSALYAEVSSIELCADKTVFTTEKYKAMLEGAKAYCLLIAQDFSAGKLSVESGIGKKLDRELKVDGGNGAGIFSLMPKAGNTVSLSTVLRTAKFNDNQTFLQACEDKYNKIMAGDDGEDAKSAEQTYCEANLEIVKALYSTVTEEADCADETKFSADMYKAMLEGANAYCLLIAKDFSAGKLSVDTGIGKKLERELKVDGGNGAGIFSLMPKAGNTVNLSTVLRTTKFNGDKTFLQACEDKYNKIMAGDDGEDAKSAEQTYCETNSADVIALFNNENANPRITSESDCSKFTTEQYKAMQEGAKAYCLLLAKDFSAGKLSLTASSETNKAIARKMNAKLKVGNTSDGILSMTDKSLSNVLTTKFNGTTDDFLTACEKTYNEIMAGEDGEKGDDACTTWCKAHTVAAGLDTTAITVKKMSAAKIVTAFKAAGNSESKLSKSQDATTGKVEGYFTDLQTCVNACKADPALMGGESSAEIQYNEDVKKEKKEGGTNFTLSTTTATTFDTKKEEFGSKIVSKDNFGTQLQQKLATDTSLKNTLKSAGVMMSADASTNMFSASDVLDLLSGGVKVQQDGTLGINAKSQKGAAVISKLTSAGVDAAAITNATATTDISEKIATVAVQAATATTSQEDLKDWNKCNQIDYMFWNNAANECQKCPAESSFKGGEVTVASNSYKRCVCDAPSQTLQLNDEEYVCTEAEGQNDCLAQPQTYYANEKCEMCPGETKFNEMSLDPEYMSQHPDAPRCICKESGYTFNENSGKCTKLGSSDCQEGTYWSSSKNVCVECPGDAPYDPEFNGCKCAEENMMFSTVLGTCMKDCPDKSSFNPETRMCECEGELVLNQSEWACVENK